MTYPSLYRAQAVSTRTGAIDAFVPQVFGETSITITDAVGSLPTTPGMGWVFFQAGNPEFPVWSGGGVSGGSSGGGGGGGGTGADEVWIGDNTPSAAELELWFDPSAEAPGSDEIHVGPDDPDLIQAGFELWVDTDATPTAPAGVALGIVAMGATTNNIVSLDPAGTLLTVPLTFTGLVGRRYAIKYQVRAIASSGPQSGHVDLFRDGTYVELSDSWFEGEISYNARPFEWLFTGDGNQHTYNLYGVGQTNMQMHNQLAAGNCYFYIEDLGPTTSPPLSIPPTPPQWNALPLLNGWTPFGTGANTPPAWRKIGDMVAVRGTVKHATPMTSPSTSVFANLPPGARPPYSINITAVSAGSDNWGGASYVQINPNGDMAAMRSASSPSQPHVFTGFEDDFSVTP